VISANTSAGKTVVGEMFLAETIWQGKKGMFVSPLKAVANEKFSDWTRANSSFGAYTQRGDLNVSICTGDFQLTPSRSKELALSHLIVMTPEMLDSRSRRQTSEGNMWLRQVGTIVVDETHLIGMESRGHRLESALMRFTKSNQDCRIVALSATLPNVEELARWFTRLNGKPTLVIKSDWRPCELNIHYELVNLDSKGYNHRQAKLADAAVAKAQRHKDDKILIFVQTKKHGVQVKRKLAEVGIPADFHSSDLTAVEREYVERRFKTDPAVRVVVSTPTLAWGVNMPARRVVICGSQRGYSNEVHAYDIAQMCGRAGRTGYDQFGDAHILLTDDSYSAEKHRLENLPNISSQIRDHKSAAATDGTLAFHLISEFHNKRPYDSDYETAKNWFSRSFAAYQKKELTDKEARAVCDTLWKINALDKRELRAGHASFAVTGLGKVASYMYLSPHDVYSYYQNFKELFACAEEFHEDAAALAWCMSNVFSYIRHEPYMPDADDYVIKNTQYDRRLHDIGLKNGPRTKLGTYFYLAASGRDQEIPQLARFNMQVMRQDLNRVITAISLIDKLFAHWGKPKYYWKKLENRIVYGVDELRAELCLIPNVGIAKSDQLIQHGIFSVAEFIDPHKAGIVQSIMKTRAHSSIKAAEKIALELKHE
jgi:helicase